MLRQRIAESDSNCSITLAPSIWRRDGIYLPAMECRQKGSSVPLFIAANTGVMPEQLPIKPAQTARLDFIKVAAELEPPRSEAEARMVVNLIAYEVVEHFDPADVTPVELILRRNAEIDELVRDMRPEINANIRKGDPPMVRETFHRLVREGYSAEEAVNMITRAFVVEFFHQTRKELDIVAISQAFQTGRSARAANQFLPRVG
jgi:hypothetical protein